MGGEPGPVSDMAIGAEIMALVSERAGGPEAAPT